MRNAYFILSVGLALVFAVSGCRPLAVTNTNPGIKSGIGQPDAHTPVAKTNSVSPVVAVMGGETIRWAEIRPHLIEAAGLMVLSDMILDRMMMEEIKKRGLTLTTADLEKERQLMLKQLHKDENQAVRLLRRLREQRGLGQERFTLMLRRNAGLRKLVGKQVKIEEAMIKRLFNLQYGEKIIVRMILVSSPVKANEVIRRLAKDKTPFERVAWEMSQDSSRANGGLLPPISILDSTFPLEIRNEANRLKPGELSRTISLNEGQLAILKCVERRKPEKVDYAKVKANLQSQLRLQMERAEMDRQARMMLEKVNITIYDSVLGEAWKKHQKQLTELKK